MTVHPIDSGIHMKGTFERPTTIFVGAGFPRQVTDPQTAYELLNEMPSHMRGPAHKFALNACRAAMNGEIDGEIARGLLEAYAEAQGILANDALPKAASARSSRSAG